MDGPTEIYMNSHYAVESNCVDALNSAGDMNCSDDLNCVDAFINTDNAASIIIYPLTK